jgi:YjbE family integral membrane protein
MPPELWSELTALVQVIIIDLVLAGDNAIVVGMAAAGLPAEQRKKAILFGIAAAAGLRVVFAIFTTQLLNVVGLLLVGGLLLLYVCWKLWRELRHGGHAAEQEGAEAVEAAVDPNAPAVPRRTQKPKTFRQALSQIVLADVSMSLDNVLAVAGTARHHLWVLVVGLALSVALMGVAATFIAGILRRFPWISYVGLALIAYVALAMIWEGAKEAYHVAMPPPPSLGAPGAIAPAQAH